MNKSDPADKIILAVDGLNKHQALCLLEECPNEIFDKVDEAIKRKDLNFLKNVNFPNKLEILNLMINSNYFDNNKNDFKADNILTY